MSLAASASDPDGTVAKVEFFNGATKLGEDATAPYAFTWSGVRPGTYTLTARATDDLGPDDHERAGDDHGRRAANTPRRPSRITSPADGATFAWKPTITITATASDPDGTVAKVEFRDGTTLLGQDTTAPVLLHVEKRPVGQPRADRPRHRQRRRADHQQPREHHRASQEISRPRLAQEVKPAPVLDTDQASTTCEFGRDST